MSEHTEGKLIAKYEWLVPEAHQDRPIGNSSNPIHDRDHYAQVVAQVRGRYHDQDANARRLAAAWNACEGVATEQLEIISVLGVEDKLMDCIGSVRNELNAARALLREVAAHPCVTAKLGAKLKSYLDACDKPGEPK